MTKTTWILALGLLVGWAMAAPPVMAADGVVIHRHGDGDEDWGLDIDIDLDELEELLEGLGDEIEFTVEHALEGALSSRYEDHGFLLDMERFGDDIASMVEEIVQSVGATDIDDDDIHHFIRLKSDDVRVRVQMDEISRDLEEEIEGLREQIEELTDKLQRLERRRRGR